MVSESVNSCIHFRWAQPLWAPNQGISDCFFLSAAWLVLGFRGSQDSAQGWEMQSMMRGRPELVGEFLGPKPGLEGGGEVLTLGHPDTVGSPRRAKN